MADPADLIPYERLMAARPALLWALERKWAAHEAQNKGMELDANENSAWLILEGEASVTHDGQTHHAGPGCWMFPKPGRRKQEFAGDFHFLSVTFRWQWPGGRHLFDEGLTRTLAVADAPWLEEAAREIIEGVRSISKAEYYDIRRHSIHLKNAALLFEHAARWSGRFLAAMNQLGVKPDTGATRDPRIESLLAQLQANCTSPLPARENLASASGISPRQLDRLLKEETGRTLAENHDAFRFERACGFLLERGRRVKEVAADLGFDELSSFSRWFTKRAGCSPRAYREQFARFD